MLQSVEKLEDIDGVSMRDVISRVGGELGELADAVHRIQSLVSLLVREDAFNDGKNVREMQSLDLIAQKIECLSGFLASLSFDVPSFWRIDTREAAQLVVLSELAARLTFTDEPAGLAAGNSGDFEAF